MQISREENGTTAQEANTSMYKHQAKLPGVPGEPLQHAASE